MEKVWKRLAIAGGIVFIFVFLRCMATLNQLRAKETHNEVAISERETDLENAKNYQQLIEAQSGVTSNPLTEEEVLTAEETTEGTETPTTEARDEEADKASALEKGNQVAALQNEKFGLDVNDTEKFAANVSALDALFSSESKTARVAWYYGSIPGNWAFYADGMSGLWLCTNPDSGQLLGYATGTFVPANQCFSNMVYAMTSAGMQSVAASGPNGDEVDKNVEAINDMAEQIKQVDTGDEDTETTEDMSSIYEAREALRQEQQQQ